jgi:hypothetical protein
MIGYAGTVWEGARSSVLPPPAHSVEVGVCLMPHPVGGVGQGGFLTLEGLGGVES